MVMETVSSARHNWLTLESAIQQLGGILQAYGPEETPLKHTKSTHHVIVFGEK